MRSCALAERTFGDCGCSSPPRTRSMRVQHVIATPAKTQKCSRLSAGTRGLSSPYRLRTRPLQHAQVAAACAECQHSCSPMPFRVPSPSWSAARAVSIICSSGAGHEVVVSAMLRATLARSFSATSMGAMTCSLGGIAVVRAPVLDEEISEPHQIAAFICRSAVEQRPSKEPHRRSRERGGR